MLVYEAVGETLVHLGVEHMFGLMGDGNLRFISTIGAKGDISYYGVRHEATSVAMADGYSRCTGKVGVCSVTQGPGLTNTLTAITAARDTRSSIVMIAGDTPTSQQGHYQAIDQEGVFEVAGAGTQPFRSGRRFAEDLDRAFRRAERERRPIGLFLTAAQQEQRSAPPSDTPLVPPVDRRVAPSPSAVSDVVDIIDFANRPIIVAGLGAVQSKAGPALRELADRIGALLYTTVRGKGLFTGHPYHLGIHGDIATELGTELIGQSDLVLSFGASLNPWTTCSGELFRPSKLIVHCDDDETAINRFWTSSYGIVGDAGLTAEALLAEVARRRPDPSTGFRTPAITERIAASSMADEFTEVKAGDRVDPRALLFELNRMLPAERTVSVDGGHFAGYAMAYIDVPDPEGFLFAVNFGAIGLSLGTGMGGAIGRPDRMSVVLAGDGGLMMSLSDIDTAVRYGLPMLIVAMNDGAFGAEVHTLRQLDLPDTYAFHNDPDIAAMARAMGAEGVTARSVAELEQISKWLADPKGPMVLDCKINGDIRANWIEEVNRATVTAHRKAVDGITPAR